MGSSFYDLLQRFRIFSSSSCLAAINAAAAVTKLRLRSDLTLILAFSSSSSSTSMSSFLLLKSMGPCWSGSGVLGGLAGDPSRLTGLLAPSVDEAAAATAAWAAKRSIKALCSERISISGLRPPRRGFLAAAICQRWDWPRSGLSKACLWNGMPGKAAADIRESGDGNPAYRDAMGGVRGLGSSVVGFVVVVETGDNVGRRDLKGDEAVVAAGLSEVVTEVRGTIVGGSGLWGGEASLMSSFKSVLGGEGQFVSGAVGLREEEEVELLGGEGRDLGPWRFCCIRQWILNQLDLLPYLDPDLDMPTMRHFRSLQALQAVRFFLSTTHW